MQCYNFALGETVFSLGKYKDILCQWSISGGEQYPYFFRFSAKIRSHNWKTLSLQRGDEEKSPGFPQQFN